MADLINETLEAFVNPIKSRVILGVHTLGRATAKQLMEMHADIPQATLYRTLNKLLELKIIEVAEENQKRGAVEKVYQINLEADLMNAQKIVMENDGNGYLHLFLAFTKQLIGSFGQYAKRPDIDILHDGSGFSASPICVTEKELEDLAVKIGKIVEPYRENPLTENRKHHTLAVIFTPPEEESR